MSKRNFKLLLTVVLVALGLATQKLAQPTPALITAAVTPTESPAPDGFVVVTRVIDGDTVELADGTRVRYLGMDTPETVNPKKPVQCYGHEASNYNRALVEGKPVRLVRDVENMDKYGRILRFIYLPDGTLVNLQLVALGYARVYTIPPNVDHAKELQDAQAKAKAAGLGLWGACPAK